MTEEEKTNAPWVSVDESMPPVGRKVLATYTNILGNNRIVLAERCEPLSIECNCDCDYDCACEYDSQRDCYYRPAGWWEVAENHEEFQLMLIADEITHWAYLPDCP